MTQVQQVQVLVDARGDLVTAQSGQLRTERQFVLNGGGEELVLGFLKHHRNAAEQLHRRPVGRLIAMHRSVDIGRVAHLRPRVNGARPWLQQARKRQGRSRFPRPIGADNAGGTSSFKSQVEAGEDRRGILVTNRKIRGCQRRAGVLRPTGPAARREELEGVDPRYPHPRLTQRSAMMGNHPSWWAVGNHPTLSEHNQAVRAVNPRSQVVFNNDQGRARLVRQVLSCPAHLFRAVGVQVGCGLIQQHDPRPHGEGACEGQTLLLPT